MITSLIIDTDFETDCDDAGALAVACALADAGRIRLLGVNASVCSPWPAAAVRGFLQVFGRPERPVGCNRSRQDTEEYRRHASRSSGLLYPREVVRSVSSCVAERNRLPDSCAFYRRLLEAAPDRSVTVCAIGLLTSIAELFLSGGGELFRRKVKRLVTMAEAPFPEGADCFNWRMGPLAAETVLNRFRGELVVSPWGKSVMTSAAHCPAGERGDLLRLIYRISGSGDPEYRRSSWDQLAVLYAAGELSDLMVPGPEGKLHFEAATGRHRWTPGDGKAVFLHPAASDEKLARLVQEWMDRACTSYSGITSKRF